MNSKLVKVVLTYEDGTERSLEGEDAETWRKVTAQSDILAFTHGMRMPELAWKETKKEPIK